MKDVQPLILWVFAGLFMLELLVFAGIGVVHLFNLYLHDQIMGFLSRLAA